jgi:hypothetical protein
VPAVLGEALSDAVRHAGPAAIDVSLTVGDEVELVARDDGRRHRRHLDGADGLSEAGGMLARCPWSCSPRCPSAC